MCTKITQHSAKEIGNTYRSICKNPEYKAGLCKKHYHQLERKTKNWIDRDEYREATKEDLEQGRMLKLKYSNQNRCFQLRKSGLYELVHSLTPIKSNIPIDYKLFCVLNF